MIVLPDSEISETEIDRERQSGCKQPDNSRRVCAVQRPKQRKAQRRQREPRIQPRAAGTYCKLMTGKMKRTLGNLVTEKTEGLVDRGTEREMVTGLSDRRRYDGSDYDQAERRNRDPNKVRRE